ncbi:MAG TPA: PQQ-dependent dehydrogenase, methanol/ethanol family [Candidatus Acidoferrales bacterium]|nr:PQQ-dependent dehydrogenase, methanol/ethanol family [Candidatus Acidoferrales bacterium]
MLGRTGKIAIALALTVVVGYWAWPRLARTAEVSSRTARTTQPPRGGADPAFNLISPSPHGEWSLPAGDLANTRYSPLNQINAQNAKNLRMIASLSTGIPHGHEGQPLVVNNTMYVVTPYPDYLMAIDLKDLNGALKWKFAPNPDPQSQARASCCDVVNRGAAYGGGKIVYQTLDDNTVAVDASTGKEAWRTQTGNVNDGETAAGAPLIVKDKVYVGNSGGEFGVRGKLNCLDLSTGKILWTAYSQGSDSDVRIGPDFKSFYASDRGSDLGANSWDQERWQRGGGTVPGWISYDPELNMIYYGTGSPGVWDADLRPGDNKWSTTIFARDADTGDAKWALQIEPHDNYGYSESMENILIDMDWNGRPRKLLLHPSRNGFMLVVDRQTGELLSAQKFVDSTNWASGYNLKTGQPITDPSKATHEGTVVSGICPASSGAKGLMPSAVSPQTGYLYIPAENACMDFDAVPANYIPGTPFIGALVKMDPGPGGFQGELVAWDIKNQKKAWTIRDKFPVESGVLATAGDVVFYGTLEGWFRAIDARSGQILWQFKTPSGIVGAPITFLGPDGKQYVAIYSGVGGWMGSVAFQDISTDDPYAALGAVGAMAQLKQYTAAGDNVFIFGF